MDGQMDRPTDGQTDGRTDGWTDGQKKLHIEVGAPPKNRPSEIKIILLATSRLAT